MFRSSLLGVLAIAVFLLSTCKKDEKPVDDTGDKDDKDTIVVVDTIELTEFKDALEEMDNVEDVVERISSGYRIIDFNVIQPLDHNNPTVGDFKQRVTLMVKDLEAPVVMSTHGYGKGGSSLVELARLIDGTNAKIEHRYFGTSNYLKTDWQYLNVRQAAADHHEINLILRKLLPNPKYLASGYSKGGETAIFYKRFYPDDIDVVVNYVGPLMISDADPRFAEFINSRGDEACQAEIHEMMIRAFEMKDTLIQIIEAENADGNMIISKDIAQAVDYAIFETEVLLWQYQNGCQSIPGSDQGLINLILSTADYTTDASRDYFGPYYYQSFHEIGNYTYDTTGISQYLSEGTEPNLRFYLPDNAPDVSYDQTFMPDIFNWLKSNGNQMIHVYGENDPWTAAELEDQYIEGTNSFKCTVPNGNHSANISRCTSADKLRIEAALEEWLETELESF